MRHLLSKILLLSLVIFFSIDVGKACSCAPVTDDFCQTVRGDDFIIKVVVTDSMAYHLRRVRVIEDLNKTIGKDTIVVLGQDGLNCGAWIDGYDPGDTLILAFRDYPGNPVDTMYLDGCGYYALEVINGQVVGPIRDTITSQSLPEFMQDLNGCMLLTSLEDELPSENAIALYPNPASALLTIYSSVKAITEVQVIGTDGRTVLSVQEKFTDSVKLNLRDIPLGIYFVRVRTGNEVNWKRFLKH